MEKSWDAAIIRVPGEAESPLHYTDISEQILSRDYYETDGATPADTVNAQFASTIKFSGIEYILDIDPELREREIQSTLRSIEQKLQGGS